MFTSCWFARVSVSRLGLACWNHATEHGKPLASDRSRPCGVLDEERRAVDHHEICPGVCRCIRSRESRVALPHLPRTIAGLRAFPPSGCVAPVADLSAGRCPCVLGWHLDLDRCASGTNPQNRPRRTAPMMIVLVASSLPCTSLFGIIASWVYLTLEWTFLLERGV